MLRQDLTGYDHKIDIYSIGILALQLVAGVHPFDGQVSAEVNRVACSEPCVRAHASISFYFLIADVAPQGARRTAHACHGLPRRFVCHGV
jgi:serine/threonine protein kinase